MKNSNPKLIVLAYHKIINVDNFESQMKYLKKNYNILDEQNIIKFFKKGYVNSFKRNLIITFDDGDISNYTLAFPILKKYSISAIFFVITGLINSRSPFWWDEIEHILGKQLGNEKVWEVKKIKNQERLDYIHQIRMQNNKIILEYDQLSHLQLSEMKESGMIIGNHSHSHPMFNQCSRNEINNELTLSTSLLKKWNLNPDFFAYPNGNYSEEAEMQLKNNKINYAFLFDHKINKSHFNPLRISRLIVNDTTPLWKFKFILSGWHSKMLPLIKALDKLIK